MHNSVQSAVAIQADIGPAVHQLTQGFKNRRFNFNPASPWWKELSDKAEKNKKTVEVGTPLAFNLLDVKSLKT